MVSTEYSGQFTSHSVSVICTVIFLQVLSYGFCSGSQLEVSEGQKLLNSIDKNDEPQNPPLQASDSQNPVFQTPPSCPNLRNPFKFFTERSSQHPNGKDNSLSGDTVFGSPFFSSSPISNFLKNVYTNDRGRAGQSPYINQASKMCYQYQKPGQPPVKMVCYYNTNNGLGNYYICRGKGAESNRNSYFQSPTNPHNSLKSTVSNQESVENSCSLNKNVTSCPKTKFPGATSLGKEDLSLITDTLSPIYDWAEQKHREVTDIDRYECLINLIDRLKCRIADEKNKYLASLSSESDSETEKSVINKSQEVNKKFPSKTLDNQNMGSSVRLGSSPETQTLVESNEESKLFVLDPVQCEISDGDSTCLKIIKRHVYPTRCDCGYPLKNNGKCPCGSWPPNQRRYYGP
ncbi:uncharacterized protein LOC111055528 [Nilaparvata lugens]|uniref:uncharacterized protein LOC111055528 n=1 Tax=Nilaparvata lugens TaxID=108931 RepID=UPI00193E589A|nr:uncharacterized protein LOC111055528 [Nilaparvata lugens]